MQTEVPGPPENLRVVSVFHDSIDLRWDPPTRPNGAITQYRVSHIDCCVQMCYCRYSKFVLPNPVLKLLMHEL